MRLQGHPALAAIARAALKAATPPPDLSISDWADDKRQLSSEASAEPGQWQTDRAAYQRGIMDAISDPAIETVVVMSSSQVGKALSVETAIATLDGWKTMGELEVGDQVFDEQGQPCRVTFATDVMHGRPCYRVVFSDGTAIIADADHRWFVEADTLPGALSHGSQASADRRPDNRGDPADL